MYSRTRQGPLWLLFFLNPNSHFKCYPRRVRNWIVTYLVNVSFFPSIRTTLNVVAKHTLFENKNEKSGSKIVAEEGKP